MAVCVVEPQPAAQPYDPLEPERLAKEMFDFGARQAWVPVGIEEALLGGDNGTGAVMVDGAALEHSSAAGARDDGSDSLLLGLQSGALVRMRLAAQGREPSAAEVVWPAQLLQDSS